MDKKWHIPSERIYKNIRGILETQLVLQDISPNLAEKLMKVAGKPGFDFKGIDMLLDHIAISTDEKGGDIEDADQHH
ncbi:MAG: hypothetical protein QGH39_06970 [Candidatus Thermoplasmatota archaeon]|nr:hypothetical protein [Candidatus Thermoplasmatota archaeon]MDP7265285.1 hypothetical protein [Candidatus Thermoplasmatota archaeon]